MKIRNIRYFFETKANEEKYEKEENEEHEENDEK